MFWKEQNFYAKSQNQRSLIFKWQLLANITYTVGFWWSFFFTSLLITIWHKYKKFLARFYVILLVLNSYVVKNVSWQHKLKKSDKAVSLFFGGHFLLELKYEIFIETKRDALLRSCKISEQSDHVKYGFYLFL